MSSTQEPEGIATSVDWKRVCIETEQKARKFEELKQRELEKIITVDPELEHMTFPEFLEKTVEDKQKLLLCAAVRNDPVLVELALLDENVIDSFFVNIIEAIDSHNIESLKVLLPRCKQADIHVFLFKAICANNQELALLAIQRGASVNQSYKNTIPLLEAIYKDSDKVVKVLLNHNVDISVRTADQYNATAFTVAEARKIIPTSDGDLFQRREAIVWMLANAEAKQSRCSVM